MFQGKINEYNCIIIFAYYVLVVIIPYIVINIQSLITNIKSQSFFPLVCSECTNEKLLRQLRAPNYRRFLDN